MSASNPSSGLGEGGQVTQAMIDEAAVFTADGGDSHCEDGTSCTHTDCYYRCMLEKVLPLSPLSRRVEELEAGLRQIEAFYLDDALTNAEAQDLTHVTARALLKDGER